MAKQRIEWNRSNFLFVSLKVVVSATCTIIFMLLMKDVWSKYQKNITSIGTRFTIEDPQHSLPYLTICPMPGFRQKGFYYTRESFKNNTFNLEDIFDDKTTKHLKNEVYILIFFINCKYISSAFFPPSFT